MAPLVGNGGRMSKAKSQRRHARVRARQRFGIDLNEHKSREVVKTIQGGGAKFLHKESHRVSHFLTDIDGQSVEVVYDRVRKVIVTCLFPDGLPGERGVA